MIMFLLSTFFILGATCSARAADSEGLKNGVLGSFMASVFLWGVCTVLCASIPQVFMKYIEKRREIQNAYPYVAASIYGAMFGQLVYFIVKFIVFS
ncbi:hypothetical protein FNI39_21920 [Salmonella enterica subsp. indica]|nr:hypothetical protein [Salmonella enterica]ECC3879173.1 hypothetical protein [Salmonella enterica subsp. indica]ECF5888635.1 hypothetical protein [Salmonella enterica subsp. indica]HAE2755397.1 hypothetical protein [Salmonella enterica subsp. indica]HBC0171720.1 hypothetical protein [Salmonella enterica subsp. indica]HBZ5824470.1 hypothetical protein [Salmonella enterica]